MTRNETLEGTAGPGSAAQAADPAPTGPLGNYTDLHSALEDEALAKPAFSISKGAFSIIDGPFAFTDATTDGLKVTRDAKRWMARAHGRRLLIAEGLGKARPASCGVAMSHGRRSVEVWRCPDGPRGRAKGPCNCGQPLLCPVCSPPVAAFRAGEVEDAFNRAASRSWKAELMVFTAPHKAGSPLLAEVDFWRDAWDEFMAQGRSSQVLKNQRLGHLGGPELTWTENGGWHYHRNLVVFHSGKLDVEAHKSRWMGCLGARYSIHAERHAFDSKAMDSAEMARYCAKQGAEIAWAEGKSSSQTPLTLLVKSAIERTPCPQWVEAVDVVRKRKLSIVRFSRGLRAELGMSPESPDEQIAEDAAKPTDELLGVLTAAQWYFIVHRRLEYKLLQVAQDGREALEVFLCAEGLGDLYTHEQISGAYPLNNNHVT